MKKVKILIKGKVKGVFFRDNVKKLALKLGLKGYVMNVSDGVEAVFVGAEDNVNEMLDFCLKGPSGAKVTGLDISVYFGENFESFEIVYCD